MPSATQAACERALLVAEELELAGTATIDAFLSLDAGELVVLEVNAVPCWDEHAALWRAAARHDPPLYPDEFARVQLLIALQNAAVALADAESSGEEEGEDAYGYNGANAGSYGGDDSQFAAGGGADPFDAGGELVGDELGWMEGVA